MSCGASFRQRRPRSCRTGNSARAVSPIGAVWGWRNRGVTRHWRPNFCGRLPRPCRPRLSDRHVRRLVEIGSVLSKDELRWLRAAPAPIRLADLQALAKIGEGHDRAQVCIRLSNGAKSAADLFCGIGTFALRLGSKMKVSAFDNHEPSIQALREAAKSPGLKPVTAATRDLFCWPLVADELKKVDFVVLDPPRQGAEAWAEWATCRLTKNPDSCVPDIILNRDPAGPDAEPNRTSQPSLRPKPRE